MEGLAHFPLRLHLHLLAYQEGKEMIEIRQFEGGQPVRQRGGDDDENWTVEETTPCLQAVATNGLELREIVLLSFI